MVLLMVVTVAYVPLVLPLLLSGVEVDAWAIASSLNFMMLLPLGAGLLARARWSHMADGLQPLMSQASSIAILLMLVGAVVLQWESIVSLIGTGGLIAIVVFLLVMLLSGYLVGGSDPGTRSVMGLGTAQRNLSAALVVGAQNYSDRPNVLVTVIVAGLIGLVRLPIAAELGERPRSGGTPDRPPRRWPSLLVSHSRGTAKRPGPPHRSHCGRRSEDHLGKPSRLRRAVDRTPSGCADSGKEWYGAAGELAMSARPERPRNPRGAVGARPESIPASDAPSRQTNASGGGQLENG